MGAIKLRGQGIKLMANQELAMVITPSDECEAVMVEDRVAPGRGLI